MPAATEARRERIERVRQSQPLAELERKAAKANRKDIHTVEGLDAAKARADDLIASIRWE